MRCRAALIGFAVACIHVIGGISFADESSNAPPREAPAVPLSLAADAQHVNQITMTEANGVVTLAMTGTDPYLVFRLPSIKQIATDWMLSWDYFCADGVTDLEWRTGPQFGQADVMTLPKMEPSEGWTPYSINLSTIAPETVASSAPSIVRIDFGRRNGVRLQLRNVKIRPINSDEQAAQQADTARRLAKQQRAEQIQRYQQRQWPAQIRSVTRNGDALQIEGVVPNSVDHAFVIPRFPESVSAAVPTDQELSRRWAATVDPNPIVPEVAASTDATPSPQATVMRAFHAVIIHDEMTPAFPVGTRFQLFQDAEPATTPQPLSAAHYPPPMPPKNVERSPLTAPPQLVAAKGLTCITSRFSTEQLTELGVRHGSVNLLVSGLVRRATGLDGQDQRPGWKKQTLAGKSWWVNEPRLAQWDRDVRTSTDGGIVVAGILLLPVTHRKHSPLIHPEATSAGTYSMPNLTTRETVEHYAAALELIAERYSGRHPDHGRIDHWIVHNEVDYGWQWTNMGEQPFEVFIDHYVRSMRLVDLTTRAFNPHARAFISLTHRWNTRDNRHWKTYAPKQLVTWLLKETELEGDFPWGIAYHPYPQSLWEADFWNDDRVGDDFDTPLITMKNLQVLDRFIKLPANRMADGSVRPVICSEQGYHADEANPAQLDQQSAALLLTWKKLRECSSVLAFDYHRPTDHPDEGGLRLGLRGLPTADQPLGAPKPAWEVFSAIGTERERDYVRRYESIWQPKPNH